MTARDQQKDSLSECSSEAWPPTYTPGTNTDEPPGDNYSETPTADYDETCGDNHGDIPWPDGTFHIIERATGRKIAITDDNLMLLDPKGVCHPSRLIWHCVEKDGYFGFQNPQSGRYIGHDGNNGIRTAAKLRGWEMWTPRQHPKGGYQLLSPFWSDALMILSVAESGACLVRRHHSTTLWEFVRV
ncbi:hypothetical protein CSUB01_05524 [Colletotrichum sublineola]|uniref:Ricin B lectin domain-containing protein n=1 Tax=Colletotrichum sublineola TaxID=1173701 RepID=A0A066X8J2_COLSU|nr:hypothetical protein CSUB01_05524 [Colletotrichum sublineola]